MLEGCIIYYYIHYSITICICAVHAEIFALENKQLSAAPKNRNTNEYNLGFAPPNAPRGLVYTIIIFNKIPMAHSSLNPFEKWWFRMAETFQCRTLSSGKANIMI